MITRRGFIRNTICAGAGVFIPKPVLEHLTILSRPAKETSKNRNMDSILDYIHIVIQKIPYKYCRAEGLAEFARLNMKCGNKPKGLAMLQDAIELAASDEPLAHVNILNNAAILYYEIGDRTNAVKTAYESFEILSQQISARHADKEIVSNAMMLDRLGDREKALWLLDERYKHGLGFRELSTTYVDLGLYDKGIEAAKQINHDLSKIRTLAILSEKCVDKGHAEKAHEILCDAVALRTKLKDNRQKGIAEDISSAYAKTGDWESAFDIAADAWNKERSYFRIATHAVNSGEIDIAKKAAYPVLADIKADFERYLIALSFPETAELFLSLGDTSQAVKLLNRSANSIDEFDVGEYFQVQEFSNAASVFIKMGKKTEPLNLLHRAFENVITEKDIVPKASQLMRIAEIYIDSRLNVGKKELTYAKDIAASCGNA